MRKILVTFIFNLLLRSSAVVHSHPTTTIPTASTEVFASITTFRTAQLLQTSSSSKRKDSTDSGSISDGVALFEDSTSVDDNALIVHHTENLKEDYDYKATSDVLPLEEDIDSTTSSANTETFSPTLDLDSSTAMVYTQEEDVTSSTSPPTIIYGEELTTLPSLSSIETTTIITSEDTTISPIFPTTKEDTPTEELLPDKAKDPHLYGYQNDPHWESDNDMDFPEYTGETEEGKKEKELLKAKERLNDIRLMDEEDVKDSMKIVLNPLNYVQDAMVHIKYLWIARDPTMELSEGDRSLLSHSGGMMTSGASFPLQNKENTGVLEGLPKGWYHVCVEVTKYQRLLEEECFTTRIFEKADPHLETTIIVLIVVAMVLVALVAIFMIYSRQRASRRKQKDKEMQDRIDKMAEKERELNERNKPAFHHIYVDPDEPYEERCIM